MAEVIPVLLVMSILNFYLMLTALNHYTKAVRLLDAAEKLAHRLALRK